MEHGNPLGKSASVERKAGAFVGRLILYCALGGTPLLLGARGAGVGQWTAWWLSGTVLALAFVPVALFGPSSMPGQFGTVAVALLIITALCTWSEALIFLPAPELRQHPFQALIGSCVLYLIVSAALAVLGTLLRLNRGSASKPEHRGFTAAALVVLLCGIAYVVYYLVFGALTYEFLTKRYYPDATRIVADLGGWFWAIQFARGVLMTLAAIPIIYTLRLRRWETAVATGAVIWIAGGLAPLLIPNPFMNLTLRLMHIAEIFAQNVSLGVTAALLLRRL